MSQCLTEKVSRQLREKIIAGKYKPGQKLPSERMLEQEYGVSRITVNRAMAMLNAQGVLERRRGIGSFVAENFGQKPEDLVGDGLVKFLSTGGKVKGEVCVSSGQEGMCKELKKHGKDLIVKYYYSESDYISELRELESNGIFGAVIWHLPSEEGDSILGRLKKQGVRFVLLDSYCTELETDYVITDNYQGGRVMTEHLISQGHKNIVYVTQKIRHFTSLENRQLGFIQSIMHHGLPITGKTIFPVDSDSVEDIEAVVDDILSCADRPTAIFASNDSVAFVVYDLLKARGVNVPEDISVAGFDDVDRSKYLEVPLTTVAQDFHEIGKKAVTILLSIPDRGDHALCNTVKIKPSLVVRNSVRNLLTGV